MKEPKFKVGDIVGNTNKLYGKFEYEILEVRLDKHPESYLCKCHDSDVTWNVWLEALEEENELIIAK